MAAIEMIASETREEFSLLMNVGEFATSISCTKRPCSKSDVECAL